MLANLIVFMSAMTPMFVALAIVVGLRRWRERDGRSLPINAKVLHSAGEQLRQRVSKVEDELQNSFLLLVFFGPFVVAVWALDKLDLSNIALGFLGWFCLIGGGIFIAFEICKIVKLGMERRQLLEGLIAELFTAQELNRLMAVGSIVFHDVPADGFNIDHVVIGPSAVYAIETKSRRKPRKDSAGEHYKVAFDGKALRFPDHVSSSPIEQASRQAAWLGREIQKVTARSISVVPAVSLPGWWIEYGKSAGRWDVKVFNPAGKGAKFMGERTSASLDESTRALIAQCIAMRYPETPASLVPELR